MNELQQKFADANSALAEQHQAQQQMQQHTLALLDQTHLQHLSKLQKQLQDQSLSHEAAETRLKQQLQQQDESAKQLQEKVTQLEQQCRQLEQSRATETAVVKALKKRMASGKDTQPGIFDNSEQERSFSSTGSAGNDASQTAALHATDNEECAATVSSPSLTNHAVTNPAAMAFTTLSLEADVLRKEARILKQHLAEQEAASSKLMQLQQQDKQQHATQLSRLQHTVSQVEQKHLTAAAMMDETIAAITSRTCLMLQQRQAGMKSSVCPIHRVLLDCMSLRHIGCFPLIFT